jgi:hypothetical protein
MCPPVSRRWRGFGKRAPIRGTWGWPKQSAARFCWAVASEAAGWRGGPHHPVLNFFFYQTNTDFEWHSNRTVQLLHGMGPIRSVNLIR